MIELANEEHDALQTGCHSLMKELTGITVNHPALDRLC